MRNLKNIYQHLVYKMFEKLIEIYLFFSLAKGLSIIEIMLRCCGKLYLIALVLLLIK